MKLLIVVKSKNRPRMFAKTTLKYISRAGYDYRIYVKKSQHLKYMAAINEAEYKYYLNVPWNNIKMGKVQIPKKYDLALYLPDNLKGFTDNKLLLFCREIGKMRSEFGKKKKLYIIKRNNKNIQYAVMVRLNSGVPS